MHWKGTFTLLSIPDGLAMSQFCESTIDLLEPLYLYPAAYLAVGLTKKSSCICMSHDYTDRENFEILFSPVKSVMFGCSRLWPGYFEIYAPVTLYTYLHVHVDTAGSFHLLNPKRQVPAGVTVSLKIIVAIDLKFHKLMKSTT